MTNKEEEYKTTNLKIPEEMNWKLRELALSKRITKEAVILMILQEYLE